MAVAPSLLSSLQILLKQLEQVITDPAGQTCRDLHKRIQAPEPAYVQRVLTGAQVLGSPSQRPALDQLDQTILKLEQRLRQIREAESAAPDEHPDYSEEIAIERHLNTLRASRLPPPRIIDLVLAYYQPLSNVIDTEQWNALIGEVPNKPLLPGTETLLNQPCSIFYGKTKDETHVCIDIPPTVDGQPLTLNRILHFAEHNRGNQIHLNIYWNRILEELGDTPIPAGQYLLLKTCLPGTKSKTYQEQLKVLKGHPEYMEATLPQVLVASLMEYIRSGGAQTHLFEEEYARTSTTVDNWRLAFGGRGSDWPDVSNHDDNFAFDRLGLAVVLRSGRSSPILEP